MATETNIADIQLKILSNIRESLLDEQVADLLQQMTNIAEYVVELLGIEVQRENEDGSISALLHLKAE